MHYPLYIPYKIILGSQSPRRKSLLEGMGLSFEIEVIPTDESFDTSAPPDIIATSIAIKKGACFTERVGNGQHLVITADTIVSIQDRILNKPTDKDEAFAMLSLLNGNMHTVYTGVCITTNKGQDSFVSATNVYFNHLSKTELEYYIDTCKPYDKAGSYGVQEWIGYVGIKKIEGCFFNVMGLPLNDLYKKLKKYSSNENA